MRGCRVESDRVTKVLALVEADTVTGPASNLLQFQQTVSSLASSAQREVRLTIAAFQRGRERPRTELAAAARAAGAAFVSIPEGFRFDPRAAAAIRRLTRTLEPDIVQSHSVKSHLLIRVALGRALPWIAFHHGYTRPDAKMAVYNHCDRVSLRAADRVVTPARAFVPELEARGVARERIAVLHNAFAIPRDLDARIAADRVRLRASIGAARHERIVVCIGRLSHEKGHADLVDALAMLRACAPQLPLLAVIAGDGPERRALVARSARAGVSDTIRWLGFVPHAQELYAAADAAVLPSHSEGSPNALLEAAAYRLPIVATRVGGVGEILTNDESALLVPPRRPDALAAALRDVLVDTVRAARMGRLARRVVERRHNPTTRARSLVALYDEVVRRDLDAPSARARACAY
jgi:glycosyltransferase involved in cell wall biosynthesis